MIFLARVVDQQMKKTYLQLGNEEEIQKRKRA